MWPFIKFTEERHKNAFVAHLDKKLSLYNKASIGKKINQGTNYFGILSCVEGKHINGIASFNPTDSFIHSQNSFVTYT